MYYVFTDLENTLVRNISILPCDILNKIKKLEKTHNFTIVTSCTISETEEFLKLNNLNWNYICECGAFSKFNNKIYKSNFSLNNKLLKMYEENIVFLYYDLNDTTYIYNYIPSLETIFPKYSKRIYTTNILDLKIKNIYKMMICIKQTIRNQFIESLQRNNLDVSLIIEDKNKAIFRILSKNVNKGYFIDDIMLDNFINYKKTISFGDSYDDIKLFRKTNLKVAVENAESLVKQESNAEALSVNEFGVIEYLLRNNI